VGVTVAVYAIYVMVHSDLGPESGQISGYSCCIAAASAGGYVRSGRKRARRCRRALRAITRERSIGAGEAPVEIRAAAIIVAPAERTALVAILIAPMLLGLIGGLAHRDLVVDRLDP
jgi:hypothetical protein